VTLGQDSGLSRAFGRRSGGCKSRAPPRPGCGLLTELPCTAIGGHSGCVLKRPGMAAPARRRIRMIMARTRPWGVVGGVGVAARVDGGRGVPGSCLLHSLLVAPFAVRAHRVIPGSSERRGGIRVTRFGWPERERVFVCRHPRSCPESRLSSVVRLGDGRQLSSASRQRLRREPDR